MCRRSIPQLHLTSMCVLSVCAHPYTHICPINRGHPCGFVCNRVWHHTLHTSRLRTCDASGKIHTSREPVCRGVLCVLHLVRSALACRVLYVLHLVLCTLMGGTRPGLRVPCVTTAGKYGFASLPVCKKVD